MTISHNTPARTIPIRFIDVPSVKKPGKKGSEEEWNVYRIQSKQVNLSTKFVEEVRHLRKALDDMGNVEKTLLMAVDGSFCNKTCMNLNVPRVHIIARCRRDAKLCFRASPGSRRIYDAQKFSPEEIRKDASIPWKTANVFYGGQRREIRYKEVNKVLWQNGTKEKPLRLIVLAPLPYVRGGRRNYRNPAYLLTTDLEGDVELLIQAYFDRWQIEYNHRDEKSILGVGEAQVRNEWSVDREPALHVAAYSALLLASIIAYDDMPHDDFGDTPRWRRKPKRNTCRALVGMLRGCIIENPDVIVKLGLTVGSIAGILRKAA